jgi:hypothetical protein
VCQLRQDESRQDAVLKSNAPKMNPNSARILRERGGGGGGLSRPIGAVKKKTLDGIEQPTFQPSISKKSKQLFEESLASSYCDTPSMSSYSCYSGDEERDGESLCSGGGGGGGGGGGSEGPQRVYERSQLWLQEKQLRMAREKAIREEELLRECSFQPKVKAVPDRVEREDEFSTSSAYEYSDGGGYVYTSSRTGGKTLAERQAEWQRNRFGNHLMIVKIGE